MALTPAILVALLASTLLAFSPTIDNGFVNWDDDKNFFDNPHFRGLGPGQLIWAFTTFWLGIYRPLAWLLFSAQYLARGLEPFAFHATSLAFHAINTLILYGLTAAILARLQPALASQARRRRLVCAALATALYAVHPLRVEPVAWASGQPYLPSAGFTLLSAWAYLEAFEAGSVPRIGWVIASLALFAAALLSHPVPVGLPIALLVLDVHIFRRMMPGPGAIQGQGWGRLLREKIPFMILSLTFIALAIAARSPSLSSTPQSGPVESLARGCHGLWFYPAKTFWPMNLSAVYPEPRELDTRRFPFAPAVAATIAITLAGYATRRRFPGLLACLVCYAAILGPNSGLIRVNDQIAADRYGYLSMMVWVVPIAWFLEWGWQRWPGRRGVVTAAMLLMTLAVFLIALSRQQCRTWKTSETLWAHALTHGADASAVAHYNLGLVLQHAGRFAAATSHYTEALRLDPGDADALNNLGVSLQRQGKLAEAEARYSEALRLKPDSVDAHYNLGTLLSRQGRFAEAEAEYNEVLRLRPGFAPAYNNLGADLFRQGRHSDAAARFAQALRHDPLRADTQNNLGMALTRLGKYEEAAARYAEALRLDPAYVEARENLNDLVRDRRGGSAEPGD